MAQTLDIGYYFEHWNTDFFSISIVLALALLLSGYFYGRVVERFVKPLRHIDTTPLGVFILLGLFQMFTFAAVGLGIHTDIVYNVLFAMIVISPLLCLVTWSNVVPKWKNLLSFVCMILVTIPICKASMELNTNNLYFDSITYLSEVIESSVQSVLGHIDPTTGIVYQRIDALHDYNGYYYVWGMLGRFVRNHFEIETSITPIYIWGSTVLYTSLLASTIVSSCLAIYKKVNWQAIVLIVLGTLFISPYYTNYFNTTLAFFGNTVRPLVVSWCFLLIYVYLKSNDLGLLVVLFLTYYAGMSVSSSFLFLSIFITFGLFFSMCFRNEKKYQHWICFGLLAIPIMHYGLIAATSLKGYGKPLLGSLLVFGVIAGISILIKKHFKTFNKVFQVGFLVFLIALVGMSYLASKGEFGYDYYFATRSLNDMCVNMTSSLSQLETIRNVFFYVLLGLLFVNYKKEIRFKTFLLILLVLFLNPLVQPAVSKFFTLQVYSRSFDLLTNPFTLLFMLYNVTLLIPNQIVGYVVTILVASFGGYYGNYNLHQTYSKNLEFKEDGYKWEYKTSQDTYDLYTYIDENIASKVDGERPTFLSQDVGLKGYVPNVQILFSVTRFRDCMSDMELFEANKDMILIMHPEKRWDDFEINGETGDLTKFEQVLQDYNPDYVIISNTLSLWDERGWYENVYAKVKHKGYCDLIFENDTWALLKVNHEYQEAE